MKKWMVVLAMIGCGGPESPTADTSDELKACPYLVPYCPESCNLVGHCPQKCACPKGWSECSDGTTTTMCNPHQTCCVGQPFQTPTCIDGSICPISRAEYKTNISYLSQAERAALADQLMRFPLASYDYKPGVADGGHHLGFIIDDVGASPAVAPTGGHVDLYGYTTMAVAALQTQAQEIVELRRQVEELRAQVKRDR